MMTASSELTAIPREVIGKANRRLAPVHQIPAVLYGRGREPLAIAIDRHQFELFAAHHAASSTLVSLAVDGEKKPINAMVREIQRSAVKGTVLHIDFLEVSMDKPVHATVTLNLINDPEGVRAGGVLTINVHELNVEAKPAELPETVEWDVSAMQIGDTLHISDISVPAGITLLDDPETIVASVQTPRLEVEEEVTEEAAEPEVIGAKPEAEEE